MVHFSVQHILVMRLITQYSFSSIKFLHSLLYMASANHFEQHDIGFYDFEKTPKGVYSFTLQAILNELIESGLVDNDTLKLTEKGHNAYFALARALTPFEDFWKRCIKLINAYNENFSELQNALQTDLRYRRTKISTQLFR